MTLRKVFNDWMRPRREDLVFFMPAILTCVVVALACVVVVWIWG